MEVARTASGDGGDSAGKLVLLAAALVSWMHYALAALALAAALLCGLRGGHVMLTFNPDSRVYHRVVAKCHSHHGRHKTMVFTLHCKSSIDKSPYVNFMEDGMIATITNDGHDNDNSLHSQIVGETELNDGMAVIQQSENTGEIQNNEHDNVENRNNLEGNVVPDIDHSGSQEQELYINKIRNAMAPVKRSLNQLA